MSDQEVLRDPGLTKAVEGNPLYYALKGAVEKAFEGSRYRPGPEVDLMMRAVTVAVDGYVNGMGREIVAHIKRQADEEMLNKLTRKLLVELLQEVKEGAKSDK